jgi:dUTP pyrophosphatase
MIKIKLAEGAKMPHRSTEGAAGWDLFSKYDFPITFEPGYSAIISTGVSVALPEGYYWDLRVRSGLSTKHRMMLLNGAAVIDEDYRGEVGVPLINVGEEPYTIQPGEKIAQVLLKKYEEQDFEPVDDLPDSGRGSSGFGSTGK